MKHLLLLIILVFSSQLYSQNYLKYYELINKAEIATLDNEYHKSDSLYQIAFSIVKRPFKEDYFLAALNAQNIKDDALVFNHVKEAAEKGLEKQRLKNFKKNTFYKKIKNNFEDWHEKYLSTINIPLSEEIAEMIKNEQRARIPILGSNKKMLRIDAYNYNRLLEIIKENGNKWPGFSTIGEPMPKGKYDVTDNIALMILHIPKKKLEVLYPYMLEAVMNGDMYPYHYARAIDYKGRYQTYGTYIDGGYLRAIRDCKNAEIERKKIGFEPIKDYYRKRNSRYKCRDNSF